MTFFVVTSADGQQISVRADSPDEALMTRREAHADGVARRIEVHFDLGTSEPGSHWMKDGDRRWLRATILAAIDGRPDTVSEAVGAVAGVEELYA